MAAPTPRTRDVPRLASLATRSALLYSALVGAAVLLTGWLIHSGNRKGVMAGRERDLEHRARTVQVRIETEVGAVANDVLFLAKSPFLRELADAWNEEHPPTGKVTDIQGTFAALLEGKPSYAQTRLLRLSGSGDEIIRMDHVGTEVIARPAEDLQSKGHRDYFRESMKLRPDEVYLSAINLNREFGEISQPHLPTLRVAAKVFDSSGQPFGLVVINVDLRSLFADLKATAGSEASLYIANRDGDYLVHPDPAKAFGFDLGTRHRLTDDFGPNALEEPASREQIVRFVRFPLRESTGEELLVGVGIPRERILSELATIRNRSMAAALGAALLAAALVWGLAFLLSRRLTNLADAIGRYEPGGGAPDLPRRGRDEVAVVARKFSSLSAKIDEQVRALEQAREVAEENRRAKEEFLATLSHEIRTPMNAVTGLLHTLATDRPAAHQRATLEALQFASRKLIAVVNDVLDFSKVEAGRITFEQAPFDLPELLESIRAGHERQASDHGVTLAVECDEGIPPCVQGDSLRLYQVLSNLVHNALKFTEAGGEVTLRVRLLAHEGNSLPLSFEVQDTGVGMTREELENALSRFGQAHPGTARKFGGTGLGLPIARMLVELQGGRFEARSEPGRGSSFRFELTFQPAPRAAPSTALPPRTPDLTAARILCVEDVASNRQVVSALLAPSGALVEFATSAAETIRHLEEAGDQARPDLILLDLQLPDRDGADLAGELRTRWPDLPIVGLTAQTSGALLERCRQAGVTTYLWKPIDPARFFPTVEAAILGTSRSRSADPSSLPERSFHLAPLEALFDGDEARITRYLHTLAGELEGAAASVVDFSSAGNREGLRSLRHRLQNGLTLLEAGRLLTTLDQLSHAMDTEAPELPSLAAACSDLLRDLASQLEKAATPPMPSVPP